MPKLIGYWAGIKMKLKTVIFSAALACTTAHADQIGQQQALISATKIIINTMDGVTVKVTANNGGVSIAATYVQSVLSGIGDCSFSTNTHRDAITTGAGYGLSGENVSDTKYSYNLSDISEISSVTSAANLSTSFYDKTYYQFTVKLKNPIQWSTTRSNISKTDITQADYYFATEEDAKNAAAAFHKASIICGAPKPATEQSADDLAPEDQTHYKQLLAHGKPAQLYAAALDQADEGRLAIAIALLQAIIDRYPDDGYAAKAIDRREAYRAVLSRSHGGAISNGSGSQQPAQIQAAKAQQDTDHQQRIQECQAACNTEHNSCSMQSSNKTGSTLGTVIGNLMNRNYAAANQAGGAFGQAVSDPNACDNQQTKCMSRCQ